MSTADAAQRRRAVGVRVDPTAPEPPARPALHLQVLGSSVAVVADDVARAQVRALWSRCLDPRPAGEPDAVITLPHSELPMTAEMHLRLASRINIAGIKHAAPQTLLLHAAGLARADGSVLGLVAPGGTGKTIAAATLGRRGFGYVTDETLAVTEDLDVLGWPKPLAFVEDDDTLVLRGPDALILARCPSRLSLRRLVVLARDPAHRGAPRLRPMDTAESLTVLVAQSSSLPRLDAPLGRLERLVEAMGGLRLLEYAEIDDAVPLLDELLEGDAPRGRVEPDPVRYLAVEVQDALNHDDGLAVLAGDRLLHLSGLGREVWRSAHGGASLEQLHREATLRIGPHPDSEALVTAAVDDLVALGLLVRDAG